jgi:phage shock protein PspC (stress-responsive transcriptional regulator)
MIYKRRRNSYIAGVCGGLEDSTNIPAILWRIGFIFIPSALWIYLIMWAFTEEQ